MPLELETIRGVLGPLVTPFRGDGELDLDALRDLVSWLLDSGVRGFLCLGTTGEAPHLDDAEAAMVVRATVEAAGGRAPVLAGSGSTWFVEGSHPGEGHVVVRTVV
jgi:4-hydroxy-tetrahydrodipicolinate synthase